MPDPAVLALLVDAAFAGAPVGCDVAPDAGIVLAAGPGALPSNEGQRWRVLGRSDDGRALVVGCTRAPGSTADTVERQWLVEVVGGEAPAVRSIGVVSDSSFQEAFTGPVRVGPSARLPASLPVWEVCGPWESGDAGDGVRSADGCRLVVSPTASRAVGDPPGRRVWTFLATGERPMMTFGAWFDVRSTWVAVEGGWRVTETWTWRAPPGGGEVFGGAAPVRAPLIERIDLGWEASTAAFVVTSGEACGNHEAALAVLDPGGSARCGGR